MDRAAEAEPTLEERFEDLVATHRDRALRLAWRLVGGDDAAAEDVTQDALVSAYRGLSRFRGDARLDTWFYRIVVRQAYSHLRWRAVRERFGQVDADEAPDHSTVEGDPMLRARIAEALDGLPRNQRDAFVLVHMEGFTVREAAEIMGKASGTVKSHLHRALGKLRDRLGDLLDDGFHREDRGRDQQPQKPQQPQKQQPWDPSERDPKEISNGR